MLDENTIIWINGEFKRLGDSKVGILTHGLHYGSSVFEGIRAYKTVEGTKIFRHKEHIERLFYSARALHMEMEYTVEEIMQICHDVIKKNGLESCYIRPIVYYGDESMGLNPSKNEVHVAVIAWSWGQYLADNVRVKISSIRRISDQTTVVDAKIGGHYTNSIMATLEAKKLGYDEALLLDHDGNIAEGSAANIFFVKGKILYTPQAGKILSGITRRSILEIAKDISYEVVERKITPFELDAFDGAFFCGTAVEVCPIAEISGVKYDTSLGLDIRDKFTEVVSGKDKKYLGWLD